MVLVVTRNERAGFVLDTFDRKVTDPLFELEVTLGHRIDIALGKCFLGRIRFNRCPVDDLDGAVDLDGVLHLALRAWRRAKLRNAIYASQPHR